MSSRRTRRRAREEVDQIERVPGFLGEPKNGIRGGTRGEGEVGFLLHEEIRRRDFELHLRGSVAWVALPLLFLCGTIILEGWTADHRSAPRG